ncbi:MAG TPA: TolC family outer membrane protein [Gammaproteobacteria bacterium]|nr:TolC family outer membrane protein [Gammaproteobacteria bacterium]
MKRTHLATTLLFFASTASIAQDELGLLEVYEQALVNDPVIREAEANFLATSEVKRQARSGLMPSLSLSGSASDGHSLNPNPPLDFITGEPSAEFSSSEADSESSSLNLSVNQTVFDWGQYLGLQQADKTIARAEVDLAVTQQDLMLRVANAYFNVLAAEDLLAADIAAREALEQQLEQTQRRFDVGLIAITNVQEATAGYDSAVATVIASERLLANAQESLREIIDIYVTDLRSPIEDLPLMAPDPSNVEAWVEIAQGQNLSLVASRISADIAQDDIRIARSSRFPTLRLSASGSDNSSTTTQTTNRFVGPDLVTPPTGSDRESESIQLSLSIPIFSGGANRSRVQQSVYRHRATVETVERFARQAERLTRDAYLGVTSEINRVQALRQALESSRTALLATQAGEEVGQRTAVDVVNAQNSVRRAETQYAASRYEYLLNILRLKQAAGSLSAADLVEIDAWLE